MIWLVQLVFDAADPDAVMQFWGQALGYRNPLVGASAEQIAQFRRDYPQFDGRGRIDDNDLRRTPVYIQRVREPKASRNRVRLEIAGPDVAQLTARLVGLGAFHVGEDEFADMEGNEFVIAGVDGDIRLCSLLFDAVDPEALLAFWSAATGFEPDLAQLRCEPRSLGLHWRGDHFEHTGDRLLHICGAGGQVGQAPFDLTPGLRFTPCAEPKTLKNRLHIDLNSTAVESDPDRLVKLGASVVQWDTDQVLADPEGNEFCLSGRRG